MPLVADLCHTQTLQLSSLFYWWAKKRSRDRSAKKRSGEYLLREPTSSALFCKNGSCQIPQRTVMMMNSLRRDCWKTNKKEFGFWRQSWSKRDHATVGFRSLFTKKICKSELFFSLGDWDWWGVGSTSGTFCGSLFSKEGARSLWSTMQLKECSFTELPCWSFMNATEGPTAKKPAMTVKKVEALGCKYMPWIKHFSFFFGKTQT